MLVDPVSELLRTPRRSSPCGCWKPGRSSCLLRERLPGGSDLHDEPLGVHAVEGLSPCRSRCSRSVSELIDGATVVEVAQKHPFVRLEVDIGRACSPGRRPSRSACPCRDLLPDPPPGLEALLGVDEHGVDGDREAQVDVGALAPDSNRNSPSSQRRSSNNASAICSRSEVLEHLVLEIALVDQDLPELAVRLLPFWIFIRPVAWRSCLSEMTPIATSRLPMDSSEPSTMAKTTSPFRNTPGPRRVRSRRAACRSSTLRPASGTCRPVRSP